ncbi:hypothetical protein [Sphingomonas lycopersici]|uniref:Uncharacterized protein n=1 Tax=Sphingomonas lycopersici TaxID=2951807 RepID=A0AA41ZD09_9SPHN|nr:hypothetical protein [Sphingomonas lycopersici]MCW6536896.1 hypothetical protein [Sphingomonas lycopersici]
MSFHSRSEVALYVLFVVQKAYNLEAVAMVTQNRSYAIRLSVSDSRAARPPPCLVSARGQSLAGIANFVGLAVGLIRAFVQRTALRGRRASRLEKLGYGST